MNQINHEELMTSFEGALGALERFFEALPPVVFLDSTDAAAETTHTLAIFGMKMVRMTVPQEKKGEFESRVVRMIDRLAEAAIKKLHRE